MKKSNATALTAAVFAAALNFIPDNGISADAAAAKNNESTYDPSIQVMANLYGPPSVFTTPTDEPVFDVGTGYMVALYGPPSFFTTPVDPVDPVPATTTAEDSSSYLLTGLQNQPLYGPPSIFTTPVDTGEYKPVTTTDDGYPTYLLTGIQNQPLYGPPVTLQTVPNFRRTTTTVTTAPATVKTTPVTDFEDRIIAEIDYSFGPLYGPMPYYGDLNGDEKTDIFDLVYARQAIVSPPNNTFQLVWNGDVNSDGVFSIADVLLLNKFLAGDRKPIDDAREAYRNRYEPEPTVEPEPEMPTYAALYGPPSMFDR